MFSDSPRVVLRKPQLSEVICQLRFPDILMINNAPPAEFQEQIRNVFPNYQMLQEFSPPKLTGVPGNMQVENRTPTPNYQFVSQDGCWKVNLTSTFISLSCKKYTCWEDFAQMLDKPLATFISHYKPASFLRIGLRYINIFNRADLGLTNVPYKELIEPAYLGLLAEEDVGENGSIGCEVNAQIKIRGGCQVKVHAAPTRFKRNGKQEEDTRFVLDFDLFMPGNTAVNMSTAALNTLHSQSFSIFRGAVTDTLFNTLDPIY